ncbi:MAG: hypothetical protein WCD86_00050 [Ktedonobacteraceae bacterium]
MNIEHDPSHPPTAAPERHLIGNALIAFTDDQFCNACTAVYLTYHVYYRDLIVSEQDIYEFVMKHMHDVMHTDRWNVGFILGWVAKMHEKGKRGVGQTER